MNIIKFGLMSLLCVTSSAVHAASALYFPSDYSPSSGAPEEVSQVSNFAPICNDPSDIYEPRLPGLDRVRGFSNALTCPENSVTGRLGTQPDYVFLIDDTANLSDYLKQQLRQKNALQSLDGREVVRPTVIRFSGRDGGEMSILVVGEMAHRSLANSTSWLTALNQRFGEDAVVAGGSQSEDIGEDDIWVAYHGSFFNKRMQVLRDVSPEKINDYFQRKWQQAAPAGGGSTSSGSCQSSAPSMTPTYPGGPSRLMNDYMRQCLSEGVPLPPTWDPTSASNGWTRKGALESRFTAAAIDVNDVQRPDAEVWYAESTTPAGICIALPRMTAGGNIRRDVGALGIICQSNVNGKACFWDNVRRPTPECSSGQADTRARRRGETKIADAAINGLDPVNMRDGYNLQENCTECHRGDNVFLVQEGSMLDFNRSSDMPSAQTAHRGRRYIPLSGTPSSRLWANPRLTLNANERSTMSGCTGCHSMPAVSKQYCQVVLEGVLGSSMPPDNPRTPINETTDLTNANSAYRDEILLLANKCCAEGVNLKNLATQGRCLP